MDFEECRYGGIAKIKISKHIKTVEGRGDELCFIYLSTKLVSQKTKDRINDKKPQKGLIWFEYSDELCLYLKDVLPANKTQSLTTFYYQMQESDRLLKLEEDLEKKKREKQKQKKKNKKQ